MRPGSAVLLVAVVLLAGCSGFAPFEGRDEAEPTVTSVPEAGESIQPPPGVLDRQVANATALGLAHARAIERESFVLAANRTVRNGDGSLRSRLRIRLAVDEDRRFDTSVSTAGPAAPVFLGNPPASAVYWSDGTTYLRRLTRDGGTTYTEFDPPGTWVGTWSYWAKTVPYGGRDGRPSTFYAALFSSVPTRVDGQTTIDGRPVLRLVDDADRPFSDDAFPGEVESIHDVSFVALVDDDGLVRSLELEYAGTVDGQPVGVIRSIRYTGVGSTTVDRPSWYDRAVSRSNRSVPGATTAGANTSSRAAVSGWRADTGWSAYSADRAGP